MELFFDLELWKKEVRGLQLTYRIYPDEEVKPPVLRELGFLRCAVLLNDGFQKVCKEPMDLKKEFYHLAREYWLNCDSAPRDKEMEIPQAYSFMPSESSERFSELARATKTGLNLSLRTVEEVGNWGFDRESMINFFNFLYRYCPTGYLKVGKYRYNPLDFLPWSFFDRENNFEDLADAIEGDLERNRKATGFSFTKSLFSVPVDGLYNMTALSCLYARADTIVSDLEDRIQFFKIHPSVKVFVKPNQIHYYWILKNPLDYRYSDRVTNIQLQLAKVLGGDIGRAGFSPSSRIPSLFNYALLPPHFISYELSDHEYSLENFASLPKLTENESAKAWSSFYIITGAKMISEHLWLKLLKSPFGESPILPFNLNDYKKV